MENNALKRAADNIRILSASMVEKAKSGHPGGAMGGADFINLLYSEFLAFDPDDMNWPFRDRFFLDPGHMSPMLYSILCLTGNFSLADLQNFRQWGSITPGHPETDPSRGIENTSGPLGQGHAMALGAAITERFMAARFGEWLSHKTYAFISDGGIQEEISQAVGRIAGHLGLGNFIMFYDSNDIQLSTSTSVVTSEDTAMKYRAWGWNVLVVNGHDVQALREALNQANSETERPSIIIGKTTMGKGCVTADGQSFEGRHTTHGQPISKAGASVEKTIAGLGGDPANPFVIFPDVAAAWNQALNQKRAQAKVRKEAQAKWESANPQAAAKLRNWLSGKAPEINWNEIEQKANSATRNASGTVLAYLAKHVDNMIVASADLSDSDKTDGFLKNTTVFKKGDFSGAFLQAGVSELTMAAIANGMALHGGVIPVCATFFVFSDYMKPVVRLSALQRLPVKYVWSHDAFRVGEDGPTHQPVEQEAQIRLMEKLKNHHGENSMLVLRPADAQETTVAWKLMLENTSTPSGLITSRQDIADLPAASGNRAVEALQAAKGAYIVVDNPKPDVVLVANGSEVSTLVAGSELLAKEKGLKVKIISAPSEGLFRSQSVDYQLSVIPEGVPVFGLTAGLPVTLEGLVGARGKVFGLDHFGYSAPYQVLDQKLGFTPENVYNQVVEMLGV